MLSLFMQGLQQSCGLATVLLYCFKEGGRLIGVLMSRSVTPFFSHDEGQANILDML